MKLGHLYQQGWVLLNNLVLIVVIIETTKRRHLSCESLFTVGDQFIVTLIDLEIFHVFLNIHRLELLKVAYPELVCGIILVYGIVLH